MSADQLLNNVAQYSLQVGLLVGLAAFVPAALRLRAPGARLAYWHLLLAACLVLPAVRPWTQKVVDIGSGVTASAGLVTVSQGPVTPAPARSGPAPFSRSEILLALLAAGAAARMGWLAVGLWRLRRYRLHSVPADARGTDDRFLSSVAGLSNPPDVLLSTEIASPVTFGFLRPVVLLPAAFPELDPRIREAILAHEFLHVRRRDWLVTLMEELVRAALWFHPAIWWLLGETQLAREQVVDHASVEMTRNREEYVDALLAIAGVRPQLDLAPAPLFLRKRHLKHRVVSLLKEVRMSKKHSISAMAAGVGILAAACWLATATFPLAAAPQLVADAPGVSVDVGGAALMHRMPVAYPEAALAAHVGGTLLVQATVDSSGNVTDASVLSGPEELRKSVIQSVLQWHFVKGGSGTKTVTITFQIPNRTVEAEVAAPVAIQGSRIVTGQAGILVPPQQIVQPPAPSDAFAAINAQQQAQMSQLREASASQDRQGLQQLMQQLNELNERRLALEKIQTITALGLSDQVRSELLAGLPVHVGDAPTTENMAKLRDAVKQFDEHLTVSSASGASPDEVEIRIAAPGAQPAARIMVGGKVQEANLIKKVDAVYPDMARSVRIQGHVILDVVIAKDGTVQEIKLVSGHPLLAPAALQAVKQWVYKPTMLNGEAVTVETQVDVNFPLQ